MKKSVKAEVKKDKNTSCGSNKKFIYWLPGGRDAELTEVEKKWFDENPDWEPGFTAYYRCAFLNFTAIKEYEEQKYGKKKK